MTSVWAYGGSLAKYDTENDARGAKQNRDAFQLFQFGAGISAVLKPMPKHVNRLAMRGLRLWRRGERKYGYGTADSDLTNQIHRIIRWLSME